MHTLRLDAKKISRCAIIAAAYTALSLLSSALNLAYGPIQLRFSEALCLLPVLLPESVWGLTLGCLLANMLSPYGPLDLIVGTAATLLAALLTARARHRFPAALPPILCNATLVGAVIAWEQTGTSAAFGAVFAYHVLTVGAGEAVACLALGLPLLRVLEKRIKL